MSNKKIETKALKSLPETWVFQASRSLLIKPVGRTCWRCLLNGTQSQFSRVFINCFKNLTLNFCEFLYPCVSFWCILDIRGTS